MSTRVLRGPAAVVVAAVALLTLGSGPGRAEAGCKSVNGHLEETQVTPLPGLTTTGRLIGGLQGRYDFTLTGGTGLPTGVILFTGESVITTKSGALHLTEAGALDGASPGNFADLQTIVAGTGAFTGASGQIFLTGNFDLATGSGVSDYRGVVCIP